MLPEQTVDVIIPVCGPGQELIHLIDKLKEQSYPVSRVIIMETESPSSPIDAKKLWEKVEVYPVKPENFDHGATRHRGINLSSADFCLCMTQDAIPKDQFLIQNLVENFSKPEIATVYARQLPAPDCRIIERYTRQFNYPDSSFEKTKKDIKTLGIKTFFCSNVCAMYRRELYLYLGGFPKHTIFNEDMIFASTVIMSGYTIVYCAEACVIHSHNYKGSQQFHRNFDMAVSQAMYPEVFQNISSEKEGVSLIKKTCGYLCRCGKPWWIIYLIYISGMKYMGYFLGKRYQKLPKGFVVKCSMNKNFWK